MDLFKKIGDEFQGIRQELVNKFKDLSKKTIEDFDKVNDGLNKEKIINASIILTSCQFSEDEDNIQLAGGIMGRGRDIVDLLSQAIMKDESFKNLVQEAMNRARGNDDDGSSRSSDSNDSAIHAMAIGPNGERIDLDKGMPDEVRDALKKMIEKNSGSGSSSKSSSSRRKLSDEDMDDFSDDIDELKDEDY